MSNWLKCALVRAIKTMAQSAIAIIGTSVVLSDVQWSVVISATILAGILSILTSIAGIPEADDDVQKLLERKRAEYYDESE